MTDVINNWNSYVVDKVIQNWVEYSLSNWWYVIWGDMSWITITSSVSFTGWDDSDSGTFFNNGVISIINWDTLFWVIPWVYHDNRSQDNDYYNSVVLSVTKAPRQDFVFSMISWTRVNDVWRGWHMRILSDWSTIKILTSYYERTWLDNTDTADYDIYEVNPAAMTVTKTWTWELSKIAASFNTCDASTFWYTGFTDFTWPVPWYVNWWFNNLQFNSKYYPTFKLA